MSLKENDAWLESLYEQFKNSTDGRERAFVLWRLNDAGYTDKANNLILQWEDERAQFLEDCGLKESDLHIDEGDEVYFEEEEMGTPGDDYQVEVKKRKVPEYLDVDYFKDYKYPWKSLKVKPWEKE